MIDLKISRACVVLIGQLHAECDRQTDGQTDRHTDTIPIAKGRASA